VRDVALAAYAHQDLPFDQLVELLNIPRDLSRTPLFQVKLVLQNAPLPALELPGLSLRRMDIDPGTAKFDLLLNIWEEQGTLVGTLDYNTDIFNQARIVRLLETYQQLLAIVVKQPGIALAALAEQMMQIDREYQQRRIEARKAANLERLRGGRRRAATSTTE
jgi:non-ribosomal peptide synthetase component F